MARALLLLMSRMLKALLCIGSAVLAAIVSEWLLLPSCSEGKKALSIASLCLFAYATLGRLGWVGQSWKGDTVVERLDQLLFWAFYWLGTFCGVLAII